MGTKGLPSGSAWSWSMNHMFGRNRLVGKNGHSVDPENNSVVVAAIGWAGRNYPKAPQIVQRLTGSQYETVPNHPALALLRKPNQYMSGRNMGQAICLSMILDGNCYIYKVRDQNKRVVELDYLMHDRCAPVPGKTTPIDHYDYHVGGDIIPLKTEDVIHIKQNVDPRNKYLGMSPLKSVINELLTDEEASNYSYAVLKNMGIVGLMISPTGENAFDDSQAELIKKRLLQDTTGDHRAEPMVFYDPINVTAQSVNPESMALELMRTIPESRICSVIGIPNMVLGLSSGDDTKTYSNYEEARAMALEDWLLPMYDLIDDVLTNELLPEFSTGEGFDERISRDLTKIVALQEDLNALRQSMGYLYMSGVIKRSIALQTLGYTTTPEDDVFYLDAQAAGVTDEMAKAYIKADIKSKRAKRDAFREAS